MEHLALGFFAVAFLAGAWYLSRLMSGTARNDGATHGGGYASAPPYVS